MYDVRYLNQAGKATGLATDCTTTSLREAHDRVHDLGRYSIPAHVVDQYGHTITIGKADPHAR